MFGIVAIVLLVGVIGVAIVARTSASSSVESTTPARNLSSIDALHVLMDDAARGLVNVTVAHVDGSGLADRVTLGTNIAGVEFRYLGALASVHDIDPRLAVFLVRLATMLRERFDVIEIDHLGIFPGKGPPTDVHNRGLAIDFAGAKGPGLDVQVLRDWGQHAAPYASTSTSPIFRLQPGEPGAELFRAIYELATREVSDREGPPSVIGEGSLILTPDHPTPTLRTAHRDHIHMQIGPTNA